MNKLFKIFFIADLYEIDIIIHCNFSYCNFHQIVYILFLYLFILNS